jgi:release factor glutamine methyltransferase
MMPPDRVKPLLSWAAARLRSAGCDTPELDSRLLLQWAAGLSREDLILEPDRPVADDQAQHFRVAIARREAREPVSRILGEREFHGRPFRVTPDTLDPRPDTETLVEVTLALIPMHGQFLELGAGTGAVAITLLAERPDAQGVATDVSAAALAVARDNAGRHGVADRLVLLEGSWFAPVSGLFDVILSNPPYIPSGDIAGLSPDVRGFDPRLALDGGADGLDAYRAIAAGAADHLVPGGHVAVEIGAGQAPEVTAIFTSAGFLPAGQRQDLAGHIRCLAFQRA